MIPRRIVSICCSNTEIVGALGAADRLVGLDNWSDWPPAVQALPRVGSDLSVDIDRIKALEPDLVLASLSVPGMERNVAALERAGLPHLVLAPFSLDEVLGDIERIGRAIGADPEPLLRELRRRIDAVTARVAARRDGAPEGQIFGEDALPRVYWEWWPKPMIAAGRRSWIDQMIRIAGGAPLFADLDAPSGCVEPAEVITRDPDVLMICWCGTLEKTMAPAKVAGRPGWDGVAGIRAGQIHCVPEALFGRPGQRVVDGLERLAAILAAVPCATSRRKSPAARVPAAGDPSG